MRGMGAGDAYRDELSAAQARIERLERELAERKGATGQAAMLIALQRERASLVGTTEPASIGSKLLFVYVVFWVAAAAFLFDHDWVFGVLALFAPFAVGVLGQKILDSNAAAASRQRALVEERIAEIERAMKQPPAGSE
jgi:hypothetical protein